MLFWCRDATPRWASAALSRSRAAARCRAAPLVGHVDRTHCPKGSPRTMRRVLIAAGLCAVASARRIYAAGSGLDMLSQPDTVNEVIALANSTTPPSVLYIGTATFDEPGAREQQTAGFAARGCAVSSLDVAWLSPATADLEAAFAAADIILISGGNTLFAVDRWAKLGMDSLMKDALARGAVLSGGATRCGHQTSTRVEERARCLGARRGDADSAQAARASLACATAGTAIRWSPTRTRTRRARF